MTQRSPFERIRDAIETKTGKVSVATLIVLGGLGLAGCAQDVSAEPGNTPGSSSSETPGGNNGETQTLTYQQEIDKAIEARPKEGVTIKVSDYPSLEVAAQAWTDAYFDCLFSGNIKMTEDNMNEYLASTPGSIDEKVPRDFKLTENFETCVGNLVTDNDYNRKLIDAGISLNADIVTQQVADRRVGVINRNFSVTEVSDNSIKAWLHFTIRVNDVNPVDTLVGSKLENVDGVLLSVDHL